MASTSKRKAAIQLTKDDDPDKDTNDGNGGGLATSATADEIKARRKVKVRRTPASSTQDGAKKEDSSAKENSEQKESTSNPFASVALRTETDAKEARPATKAVFGATTGFSGFGSSTGGTSVFGGSTGFKGWGSKTEDDKKEETQDAKPYSFSFAKVTESPGETHPTPSSPPTSVLPSNYVVKSGEEDEKGLLELRCKTYRWGVKQPKTEVVKDEVVASVPHSDMQFGSTTGASSNDKSTDKEADGGYTTEDGVSKKEDDKSAGTSETETKKEGSVKKKQQKGQSVDTKEVVDEKKPTWIEVGVGPVRLLQSRTGIDDKEDSPHRARLVQRRQPDPKENPTKVLVNLALGRESIIDQSMSEQQVRVTGFQGEDIGQFVFKFKEAATANEFSKAVTQARDKTPRRFG